MWLDKFAGYGSWLKTGALKAQSQLRKMRYRCVSDANAGRFLEFSVTFIDRRLETGGHRWVYRCPDDVPTSHTHP